MNTLNEGYYNAFFENFVADVFKTPAVFSSISVPGEPSNTDCATQAAARTNPSRPYVDVPVALLELGDVISLVRDSGRSLIRKAAGANIKNEFGIQPLASDLAKLTRLSEQVDRRVRELERLASPKGLRRTVDIWEGSASQVNPDVWMQSAGVSIRKNLRGLATVRKRVHIRWRPEHVPNLLVPEHYRALARRAVSGSTVDLSTAWELMPWSWLIDWGTNVGTYLKANRNIIPAWPHTIRVMRHSLTEWTWTPSQLHTHGVSFSSGSFIRESKSREPASVAPIAHFPFLNGRQVGIAASLSVLRGRRVGVTF